MTDRQAFSLRALFIAFSMLSALAFPDVVEAAVPQGITLEFQVGGFSSPVAVRHAGDGSGRLFIVERAGRIMVWDPASGDPPSVFLDIRSRVDDTLSEQGLLGLAFHPNYVGNRRFYVNYTRDPGAGLDRTRIERYTATAADPDVADPSSAVTVLELEQDDWNHNGGDLHFGSDGYLYIGMGDGGNNPDQLNRGQDLGVLLGKMLRIDVDGAIQADDQPCGLVTNYAIPDDNPFQGDDGACDEIWAFGLRNPWRFSFDRQTGDLLIGDVGEGSREEIDFQPAGSSGGENYGWSCMEGDLVQNFNPCLPGPLTDPILVYSHAEGCSVTGGFRYRGQGIGGLSGIYFYADFCSGTLWAAERDGAGVWSSQAWGTAAQPGSFGEDEAGELYLLELSGSLYRFEGPGSIFLDDFESGDTSGWSASTP